MTESPFASVIEQAAIPITPDHEAYLIKTAEWLKTRRPAGGVANKVESVVSKQ